ncbi:hypothetical protein HDE_00424 [Halotydeus destructor]|nr:hypothetical protein HDE_00424 [Halotydeus destructor]
MMVKVLSVISALIAVTSCVSITHEEVESAFAIWFDNAFKFEHANQSYDLIGDATQYDEDYLQGRSNETYPSFKLSQITFNVYRHGGPGRFLVSNRIDGIHLGITEVPIRVLYRAVSEGDADTPPFAICGSYGRRLTLVTHRPRDGHAKLLLDAVVINKFDSKNDLNADEFKFKSFKVCSDLQENRKEEIKSALEMRRFWDYVRPLAVEHVKGTFERSTRSIIVTALHDLFSFSNFDIDNYKTSY